MHNYGIIASRFLVKKKEDLGASTITYTIECFNFSKTLYYLGANINLISVAVYKQLGLGSPKSTLMRLFMADRTMKKLVKILCDILVRVASLIFLTDFVILDYEVDFKVFIILGRPLFVTGCALVDMKTGQMMF